jgi:hypothetical protein
MGVAQGVVVAVLFVLLGGWLTGVGLSVARFVIAVPVFAVVFGLAFLMAPSGWRANTFGLRRRRFEGGGDRDVRARRPLD